MNVRIQGLHHVTALAADVQANISFYVSFLGLRLVKQTVNYDAPHHYHLYFGNSNGDAGTLLTFFVDESMPPGRIGSGQVVRIGFSVAANSLEFWLSRMKEFGVAHSPVINTRWEEFYIRFEDFEGLPLELVANGNDNREGWGAAGIPLQHTVKGLYGATICIRHLPDTVYLLKSVLQYKLKQETTTRHRFAPEHGIKYGYLDIQVDPFFRKAKEGAGTFHHLAFATPNESSLKLLREALEAEETGVTTVLNRTYFQSVYFFTPSGVTMEVATQLPGFMTDETEEGLGKQLQVPGFLKDNKGDALFPPTLQIPD